MTDPVSSSTSSTPASSYSALLQFGGVASGLDTKALIDALLQPETARVTSLQNQVTAQTAQRSAYTTLQTALTTFLGKVQAFTMLNTGSARSATSADATKFTATANQSAVAGQYRIMVDHLATATVATSTAPIGTPVTDPTQHLADLPLPGTVKGGTLTMTVDNQIVSATIGDPATTTLQDAMTAIAGAITSKLGGDGTATVSVVNDRLQIAVSGNTGSHSILVGASADTSNLFGLAGLTAQRATIAAGGGVMTGSSQLGVVQAAATLDAAGLTGLTSTTSGVMTINGVDIAYDTTTDTLSGVLTRINQSKAGVTASIDRANDTVVLTSKTPGAQPIVMADSGTLLGSLKLGPGTTTAQTIGQNSLVYVNDKPYTSATNQVTGAIDNVTLNLVAPTTTAVNLTVDVDESKIEGAISDLVTGYNNLADQLDALTANKIGETQGPLASDLSVGNLLMGIRQQLFAPLSGATGSVRSLLDLGVSTGKVGAAIGTTSRLTFDKTKLQDALANDPGGVAQLLGPSGTLAPTVTTLKAWTDYGGYITARTSSSDDLVRSLNDQLVAAQDRVDSRRAMLEQKYAAMESTLSTLQQTLASLNSQAAQANK